METTLDRNRIDDLLEATRYCDLHNLKNLASASVSLDSKDSHGRTDMSFAERQKAGYAARQKALDSVQPDPQAVVLRGSLSEVSAASKPPTLAPQKVESSQQKRSAEVERGHGAKDVRSKRSRTEEPPKDKRSNPGNVEQQTRTKSGENDQGRDKGKELAERDSAIRTSASRTPSWFREGFQLPVTQTGLINLAVEINKSAPALTGLHLTDPQIGRFMGHDVLERCIDSDTLRSISSIGVNDSLGLLSSHLAQVAAYTKHLANMASSADTSKQMVIALEKKVSEKDVEILSLKDSVKSVEKKLHQSLEREMQSSSKLNAAKAKIAELERKLQKEIEEKAKFKSVADKNAEEVKELTARVEHYKSAKYTEEILDIFQKSEEYQSELFAKAFVFYDRGAAHVLRQFHHLIPDKRLMWKVFEGSYTDRQFRSGADFIPYSEEELREIAKVDAQVGEVWTPPHAIHPTFYELCDQFRNEPETTLE